jgi:hypothetical protein
MLLLTEFLVFYQPVEAAINAGLAAAVGENEGLCLTTSHNAMDIGMGDAPSIEQGVMISRRA